MPRTEPQAITHRHLLILARKLASQMRYNGYPKEWTQQPLTNILPLLFQVLNYHPGKLGDTLQEAYSLTFPKAQKGNLNQLGQVAPRYFSDDKQYYLDLYGAKITHLPDEGIQVAPPEGMEEVLRTLGDKIVSIYASTAIEDENTYRTLNTVVDYLYPLFARTERLRQFGFNIWEFQDYWPKMSEGERKRLAATHFDT